MPERCTKDVNVYEVSFQNIQSDYRTYGILSVPVKEGNYPALLRVPGAGVRPYSGDIYTVRVAADGRIIGYNYKPEYYNETYDFDVIYQNDKISHTANKNQFLNQ